MRRRLIGDDIRRRRRGARAPAAPRRRCPAGRSTARRRRGSTAATLRERDLEVVGGLVEVAGGQPPLDALRIHLDDQRDALVHRDRERLRAAHAAEAGGHGEASGERCRRSGGGRARPASRTCPAECPACRCRSSCRPSSGRTSSGRGPRDRGTFPTSPTSGRGWRWRSARAARGRACGRRRPACPTARAASRRRRAACSSRDDRVEGVPAARRAAGAAVDDEIVGAFGDVGIEIVHQHPQRGFLEPSPARQRRAARCADETSGGGHRGIVRRVEREDKKLSTVHSRCQIENAIGNQLTTNPTRTQARRQRINRGDRIDVGRRRTIVGERRHVLAHGRDARASADRRS